MAYNLASDKFIIGGLLDTLTSYQGTHKDKTILSLIMIDGPTFSIDSYYYYDIESISTIFSIESYYL